MSMLERTAKIKEIVFNTYPNVFDYSVIKAVNTKDNLDIILTIKKNINSLPTKIHILIKDNLEYELKEED